MRRREGILSVYLDFEPAGGERRDPVAATRDALAPLRAAPLDERLRARLEGEIERVLTYLREEEQLRGRSLVVFSCEPRGLWEAYWLQVPVRPLARFGERAHIAQLAGIVDEHERYGVVLLDKERARVLVVYLNRVEHDTEVFDTFPGQTKMGGWAQARYSRHREAHLHRHVLHVVEAVQTEARRRPFDRLIAGGPDEALSAFLHVLPRGLASRLAGTFAGELFLSNEQVLEHVRALEEQVERTGELRTVRQLIDAALAGGAAAVGWDDTLAALIEGRVHKLVLAEGVSQAGSACPAGHLAVVEPVRSCPVCGAALQAVADLAERAVELAFDEDGRVELVRGVAAEALAPHGGIGALLRF